VRNHRSNSQYFKEKNYKAKFLTTSIFKKNKIDKYNFENKKNRKIMWENTVAIHNILKENN
jgi:hypothetical protein